LLTTAFEAASVECGEGQTILMARDIDQSALYGLLDRLRDFNLELVSLHEVPGGDRADSRRSSPRNGDRGGGRGGDDDPHRRSPNFSLAGSGSRGGRGQRPGYSPPALRAPYRLESGRALPASRGGRVGAAKWQSLPAPGSPAG